MIILYKPTNGIWVHGKPEGDPVEKLATFLEEKAAIEKKIADFQQRYKSLLEEYKELQQAERTIRKDWYQCEHCEYWFTIDCFVNIWTYPNASFPDAMEPEAMSECQISSACIWCCGYSIKELEENQMELKLQELGA